VYLDRFGGKYFDDSFFAISNISVFALFSPDVSESIRSASLFSDIASFFLCDNKLNKLAEASASVFFFKKSFSFAFCF